MMGLAFVVAVEFQTGRMLQCRLMSPVARERHSNATVAPRRPRSPHLIPAACLIIGLAFAATSGFAAAPGIEDELPGGWRLPVAEDYFDRDVFAAAKPLRIDVDGDGARDEVYLLVRDPTGEGALFVKRANTGTWQRASASPQGVADYVLSAAQPGTHAIEGRTLRFAHEAIVLREVEYGTGTVHWLEAGAWRSAPIAAGDLDAARRAE